MAIEVRKILINANVNHDTRKSMDMHNMNKNNNELSEECHYYCCDNQCKDDIIKQCRQLIIDMIKQEKER